MGKIFQKIHGCSVGNFEGNGDKIPQWIRANGGNYTKEITRDVTHLITTREAYKKNGEAVREAKKLRTVKIVTYDWLEDSLLSKTRRPKREKPYLLETILKGERKKAKNAKRGKQGKGQTQRSGKKKSSAAESLDIFENNCLSTKTKLEAANYHLYTDKTTNITYNATLVRPTILGNQREKYLLKVYESNNQPHVYAAYVKYSRVGKSATHLLAPLGSNLDFALTAFKRFFKLRTGKEWEKRFDETSLPPMRDDDGNVLPPHEGWYQYENQMGILASFMRHGSGDMPGESGADPDSVEDVCDRQEGGTGMQEMDDDGKGSDGNDEDEQSGAEEETRSTERMSMGPDERKNEADAVEYNGLQTGASTNVAIVID